MTDLEKNLQEVHSILFDEPLVKEYLSLKKQIESSEYLSSLQKEIIIHEKEMTKNANDEEVYFKEKEIYEDLKSKFDNDPLIINFKNVSEDLLYILNEVKQVLL